MPMAIDQALMHFVNFGLKVAVADSSLALTNLEINCVLKCFADVRPILCTGIIYHADI